jgi:hypothetical protein
LRGFECAKLENECLSTLSDLALRCPIIILIFKIKFSNKSDNLWIFQLDNYVNKKKDSAMVVGDFHFFFFQISDVVSLVNNIPRGI